MGGAGRWVSPRLGMSGDCTSHAAVDPPSVGRSRRISAHPPPPTGLLAGAAPPLGRRRIPGVLLAAGCGCFATVLVDCSLRICDILAAGGGFADAEPPHAGTAGASAGTSTTGGFFSAAFPSFFSLSFLCFFSLFDASSSVCSVPCFADSAFFQGFGGAARLSTVMSSAGSLLFLQVIAAAAASADTPRMNFPQRNSSPSGALCAELHTPRAISGCSVRYSSNIDAAVGEYSKRSLSPSTRRVIIGAPSRFSPTAVSEGIARTPALAATSTSSPQVTTGWSGSTPSSLGSRAAICWPVAHASPSLSSFGTPIPPPLCDVPVGRSETFHRRQEKQHRFLKEESRKCF